MISNEAHQGNVVALSEYILDQAYQKLEQERNKEGESNENTKVQNG
jgi:hypothetical protein